MLFPTTSDFCHHIFSKFKKFSHGYEEWGINRERERDNTCSMIFFVPVPVGFTLLERDKEAEADMVLKRPNFNSSVATTWCSDRHAVETRQPNSMN